MVFNFDVRAIWRSKPKRAQSIQPFWQNTTRICACLHVAWTALLTHTVRGTDRRTDTRPFLYRFPLWTLPAQSGDHMQL